MSTFAKMTADKLEGIVGEIETESVTFKELKLADIQTPKGIIRRHRLLIPEVDTEDFVLICKGEVAFIKEHHRSVMEIQRSR